jgi:hypothetical protein
MASITYARDYPGDLGEKLRKAYDALTADGGIIDARDQGGDQVVADPVVLGGNWAKMVTLLLGRANIRVRGTITLGRGCAIVGQPTGAWVWKPVAAARPPVGTHLIADAAIPAVIDLGDPTGKRGDGFGTVATLRDLTLHAGTGALFAVVRATNVGRADLTDLTVVGSGAPGHGIALEHCPTCRLTRVISIRHSAPNCAGLYLVQTNDTFVTTSEFMLNALGVVLVNSSAVRFVQNDVSGNAGDGIVASGRSSGLIAIGNQFVDNGGHDIGIDADPGSAWAAHVISANRFNGSDARPDNTRAAVRLANSTASTLTGNWINLGGRTKDKGLRRAYAGIQAVATGGGRSMNAITGNATRGTPGDGGPIDHTAGDVVSGNVHVPAP